jgi:cell division protein YceG involved in septum cleavage
MINRQLWNRIETGGVIGSLIFLVMFCLSILIMAVNHYQTTQEEIILTNKKIKSLTAQIDAAEVYEKLSRQEVQKFNTFKRKKWKIPLTQDRLNQSLYALQKSANVEFLFIHSKISGDTNNITKANISLNVHVLRDQSFINFLQKLETDLPGIIKVKKFELKRTKELNRQLSQKVSEGEKVSLFEGTIDFELEYAPFCNDLSKQ